MYAFQVNEVNCVVSFLSFYEVSVLYQTHNEGLMYSELP